MHFYRFQYGPEYGAPQLARSNSANYINTASLATTATADSGINPFRGSTFGSIPTQLTLNTSDAVNNVSQRTLALTTGSLPTAQVYVYDVNNKLLGGINASQYPTGNAITTLNGHQDIYAIIISNGKLKTRLDLRQAQGWLNNVLNIGVTVGLDGKGALVGSISNLDAVQNTYPDRDGVTFGTKCTYILGDSTREGGLYCS